MYSDDEEDSGSSDESVVGQRYTRWPATYEDRPIEERAAVEITSAEEELSDHRGDRDSASQAEDEEYDDDLATHWRAQLLSIIKKRLPKECSSFKLAKMLEEAIMTECEDEHGEVDVKKYKEVAENVRKRLSYTRTDVVPTLLAKAYKSEDPFIILNHFKSESKNQIKKKRKSGELAKATDTGAIVSGNKIAKDKMVPIVGSKPTDCVKRKAPSPSGSQADEDDDDVPLSSIKAVRLKPKKKHKVSAVTRSDSRARTSPAVDSPLARSGSGPPPKASTAAVLAPADGRAATVTADGSTSSLSSSSASPLHTGLRPASQGGEPSLMTPPQASMAQGGQRSAGSDAGQGVGGALPPTGVGAGKGAEARKAMQKRREEERLKREADKQRMLKVKAEEQQRKREREEAERRRREEGKRRAEEERKKAIERARAEARQRRSVMCRVVTFDDANAVLDQIRRSGIDIYSTSLVK